MARYLIFLGLVSICGLCVSQECNKALVENVDFPGTDITFLYSPDAQHCQQLCTNRPDCKFFTFIRSDWTRDNRNFYCYLKSTPNGQPKTRSPLPGVTSGFSLKHCTDAQECNKALVENVDFPGTDITFVYAHDAKHCQQLCTKRPDCKFFTFIRAEWTRDNRNFYCYIKSTPNGQPNTRSPLLGVTSGFSLKHCTPEPCPTQVYQNVDFPGADYKMFFTADYEECRRACTQDPSCQFFTFVIASYTPENIRYKCHLKFSWTIPRTPIVERKAGVVSGFSHKMFTSQNFDTACQPKLFPRTDIPGNSKQTLTAASAEHCLAMCSAHPQCTFFSFDSNDFKCYLKENRNTMVIKAKEGVTSGIPSHFCQLDNSWIKVAHEGVDFRGSDIRYVLLDDPVTCQRTCTEDPLCQFYTYVNKNFSDQSFWRRCFLKRVVTLPAPPKVMKQANVVSGFSGRECV